MGLHMRKVFRFACIMISLHLDKPLKHEQEIIEWIQLETNLKLTVLKK